MVDPAYPAELEKVLKEELAAAAPSVVICRRPCALLKGVEKKPPLRVDREKCRSCKACMKIGCPCISMVEGADGVKAKVDETMCVGCGLCEQMCPFDAFASTRAE